MTTSSGSTPAAGRTVPLTSKDGAARDTASRRRWDLGLGDAESAVAEARKALFVMVGFIVVIWALQIASWVSGYRLTDDYAIRAHDITSLPDIFTAPFFHVSWNHIEANSGPLFIFGFLAAYRGVFKFLGVTLFVIVTSGLAAWLTGGGVGASGVVFGYFGYVMVRGFFDRHSIDMIVGVVMALCFYYSFADLAPHQGIGWEAHIGGLVGGVAAGWIFRERRPRPVKTKGALPARSTSTSTSTSVATGSRADLHKQLDDLGL